MSLNVSSPGFTHSNPKISALVEHLLGAAVTFGAGFHFLLREHTQREYFFFQFRPYEPELAGHPVPFILPLYFGVGILLFALLCRALARGENAHNATRQAAAASLTVYFYILLLILEADTRHGAAFYPLPASHSTALLKILYIRAALIFCLMIFYTLICRRITNPVQTSGGFRIRVEFFMPLLPLAFNYAPGLHACLTLSAFLIARFFPHTRIELDILGRWFKKYRAPLLLTAIFLLAFLCRLWNLNVLSKLGKLAEITDGPGFHANSLDLWNGLTPRSPTITPSYSYLLYLAYHITGPDLKKALMVQALAGSLMPVLLFFICRRIFSSDGVGYIAAFCAAMSYHLILYSTLAHRGGAAAVFLTAAVLMALKALQENGEKSFFFPGFLSAWTMMLEAPLAPFMLLALALPFIRKHGPRLKPLLWVVCGFIIAELSFNWIIIDRMRAFYPLGRETRQVLDQWNYAQHPEGEKLAGMGFHNPITKPIESLGILISAPGALQLYLRKCFKEFQTYFLDTQTIYIDPLFLHDGAYFSSSVSFYYYPVLAAGILACLFSRQHPWREKLILGFPVIFSTLFYTFFWFGTNRYRINVQPLFLIFFAYGLHMAYKAVFIPSRPAAHEKEFVRLDAPAITPSASSARAARFGLFAGMLSLGIPLAGYFNALPPGLEGNMLSPPNHLFLDESSGTPQNLLTRSGILTEKIILYDDAVFDIWLQFAESIGNPRKELSALLLLDGVPRAIKTFPRNSRWIVFEKANLKKGERRVSIQAVRMQPQFNDGESDDAAIKLMSIVLAEPVS